MQKYCPINSVTDENLIKQAIVVAQDSRIESQIGTDLMEKVKADSAAGTITGDYLTLRDSYMVKAITWWAYVELLGNLYIRVDNGGLFMRNSADGTQITVDEFARFRQAGEAKAITYTDKLVRYLSADPNLFPELNSNQYPDKAASLDARKGYKFRFSGDARYNSNRKKDRFA